MGRHVHLYGFFIENLQKNIQAKQELQVNLSLEARFFQMEVADFEPFGGLQLVPKRTITLTKLLPFFGLFWLGAETFIVSAETDNVSAESLKIGRVPNRLHTFHHSYLLIISHLLSSDRAFKHDAYDLNDIIKKGGL